MKRTTKRTTQTITALPLAGSATPKRTGRPAIPYDPDIAAFICEQVAAGSNLSRIVKEYDDLPKLDTIYRWLRESESFNDDYTRARATRGDWRNDKMDDIVARMLAGEIDSNTARVAIDALKWQAGKEAPKYYGDYNRTELEVKGDVADALSQARQRLAVVKPKPADSSAA